MTCRESSGGRAVSGFLTAGGVPSRDVPALLHRLSSEARTADPATANEPADRADVEAFYRQMEASLRSNPRLDPVRRERNLARLQVAQQHLDDELPSRSVFHSWKTAEAEWQAQSLIASQSPEPWRGEARTTVQGHRVRPGDKPYHKRFKNFSEATVTATDALFASRPSRLSHEERDRVFRDWLTKASEAYDMEPPTFEWDEEADYGGGGFYSPANHSITMSPNHPSVTTLIHEFRHALQHKQKGAPMVDRDVEVDARAWSLSLYYKVRPALFERLVREGRIFHIAPEDL